MRSYKRTVCDLYFIDNIRNDRVLFVIRTEIEETIAEDSVKKMQSLLALTLLTVVSLVPISAVPLDSDVAASPAPPAVIGDPSIKIRPAVLPMMSNPQTNSSSGTDPNSQAPIATILPVPNPQAPIATILPVPNSPETPASDKTNKMK